MLLPLLLSLASPSQDAPQHFSCGPFLLQPGTSSMTIVVDHETAVPASLRYWSMADAEEQTIHHDTPERHHVFALTDLEPGATYGYQIDAPGLSSGTHEFRTLPDRPESYRVLAIGDVRSQPKEWGAVAGRMFEHEGEALFAIGTGDYPNDGRKYDQWINEFFAPARSFLGHTPFWPAIGNHEATRRHDDVTRTEESHYFSLFELPGNERWFRVDYHLITLLILDSNSRMNPRYPQYEWLRDELRSPRNRFTLVAFHHAPITSGPHGHIEADGTPREWPLDEGRRFLVPLFEMYDVDLVLTGHDHLYERSTKDGVVYVVTGGGGAPLYRVDSVPNPYQEVAVSTHHYMAIDVSPEGLELSAYDAEGKELDRATIPSTEDHVRRRTASLTEVLEAATEFGALDPRSNEIPAIVTNPFDHPLTVQLKTARRGNTAETLTQELAPRERREIAWYVQDVAGGLDAEPWSAAVLLDARVSFRGRDQATDLDVELRRKLTAYSPVYQAPRRSVVQEGFLDEDWKRVPRMTVGEASPVVRGKTSYDGANDFEASLALAWDEGWLHLGVDVRDDRILDDGETDIDQNDSIRVLFHTPAGDPREVILYSFSAGGRTLAPPNSPTVKHGLYSDEKTWRLEASFPFEALGLNGSDTRSISCDFLFVDRDETEKRAIPSYHRMWTDSRSRMDTTTFGRIQMVD